MIMNQRYVLKNSSNELFFCVLTPEQNEKDQWEAVFAIHKGQGFTVERCGDRVKIVDYFHGETMAAFSIVSVEETTDEPSYRLSRE